jgi:hypothetical protein
MELEEIIDGVMPPQRAWGSPLSRAEAASITDKAIRRRRRPIKALTLVLLAAICFALWIIVAAQVVSSQ